MTQDELPIPDNDSDTVPNKHYPTEINIIKQGFLDARTAVASDLQWKKAEAELYAQGYTRSKKHSNVFIKGLQRAAIHRLNDAMQKGASSIKRFPSGPRRVLTMVRHHTSEVMIFRWNEPSPTRRK